MKKALIIIAIVIASIVVIAFVAAIVFPILGFGPDLPTDYKKELAKREKLNEWPQNEYTAVIPEFNFNDDSVFSPTKIDENTANNGYSIYVSNVSEDQYKAFVDALIADGYSFDKSYHIDDSYYGLYSYKSYVVCEVNALIYKKYRNFLLPACFLGKGMTSVSVAYCAEGSELDSGIYIDINLNTPNMYLLHLSDQSEWPENESTKQIVVPDFVSDCQIKAGTGFLNGEELYCIKLSGVSKDQYDEYIGKLTDSGFVSRSSSSGVVISIPESDIAVPSNNVTVINYMPVFGNNIWQGKMETENGSVDCKIFYHQNTSSFYDTYKLDPTPFIYINIITPAK